MRYEYVTKQPAVCLSATGLRVSEFDQLIQGVLPKYVTAEQARLERPNRKRAIGGGQSPVLSGRDQILMGVVWRRLYPTNEGLGYLFGVSDATVSRYSHRVVLLLEAAGKDPMRMPDPGRKRRKNLSQVLGDRPELAVVIDRFEQKVQRPADPQGCYSGKKKMHTLKRQLGVDDPTGQMVDVSASVPGPTADIDWLDQSGLLAR